MPEALPLAHHAIPISVAPSLLAISVAPSLLATSHRNAERVTQALHFRPVSGSRASHPLFLRLHRSRSSSRQCSAAAARQRSRPPWPRASCSASSHWSCSTPSTTCSTTRRGLRRRASAKQFAVFEWARPQGSPSACTRPSVLLHYQEPWNAASRSFDTSMDHASRLDRP